MFFKILSHFQDDRKKIIIILACLGVILLFLKTLEYYQKRNTQNGSSNKSTTAILSNTSNELKIINSESYSNDNNTSNNIKIDENSINSPEKAIDAFTIYCNNNEIENAYNLLTDDCKKYVYKSSDEFYNNYYKIKFNDKKDISYFQYGNKDDNLYKIYMNENPLVTGNIDTSSTIIDYISIQKDENDLYKLNIGGFIKEQPINKSNENEYIKINVKNKLFFMDYELYEIEIENKTYANMNIGNVLESNDIYIEDGNEQKYYLNNDDYVEQDLLVNFKSTKTITLKFNKSYTYDFTTESDNNIKKIIFSDIQITNRQNYDDSVQTQLENGDIQYEKKYTTYPNNTSLIVEIEH